MYDPFLLADMDKCVSGLIESIEGGVKIRVIGDYDIDGVCASYILYRGIKELGGNVDVAIPERIIDGYGLNERLILEAYKDGVETIITCDNGIAAKESVALGKEKQMKIFVTDHHEIPFRIVDEKKEFLLPDADAVVNPHREDCNYPFKGICGALVAYKVIDALFRKTKVNELCLRELLGFAAFATIGDVMQLVDENRIVVQEGLQIIEQTKNKGLIALKKVCELNEQKITPYHIGFILGPCVNATGRLDSAKRAVKLFVSNTDEEAFAIASKLKEMNEERKQLTLQGVEDAIKYIEEHHLDSDKVLLIYLEDCHESIAGIIAGRIREKYQKPTFVLTKAEAGVKGSGRSIDAYHMFEKMNECKELMDKFGGHKAAAGLSLQKDKIEELRMCLNKNCDLTDDDLQEVIRIDLEMPLSYVHMGLLNQMELLEPFGVGNKKPMYVCRNMRFVRARKLGKTGRARVFVVEDEKGRRNEVIHFGDEIECESKFDEIFGVGQLKSLYQSASAFVEGHILYYSNINEYKGRKSVQNVLVDYKKAE
jgi:single-stranded-DNA-specific exonuclease